MEWYEKEGFDSNPFETDPFRHNYALEGQDKNKEELLYRILSGDMLLIEGKEGSGKTALLKHAIDNFRGKGKVIYVDGKKVSKRLNIEKLLKRGVFRKTPKGMILLLDNVQNLTKRNCERIKFYYDQDYLKSVVFTTENYASVSFTNSIRDRIGKRIMRVKEIAKNDAVKMVKDRIGGKDTITTEDIAKLLMLSDKNPKKLLQNSEKLYAYIVKNNKEKGDIKRIISTLKQEEKKEEERCFECDGKLAKIKDNWRCPSCDTYCMKCGTLVDETDTVCPDCGEEFEE